MLFAMSNISRKHGVWKVKRLGCEFGTPGNGYIMGPNVGTVVDAPGGWAGMEEDRKCSIYCCVREDGDKAGGESHQGLNSCGNHTDNV